MHREEDGRRMGSLSMEIVLFDDSGCWATIAPKIRIFGPNGEAFDLGFG